MAPRSLTARLVLVAVLLVAGVSTLVGTATAFAMRNHVTDQLDRKVVDSARRVELGPGGPRGSDRFGDPERFGRQEPGTLLARPDVGLGAVLEDRPGAADLLPDDVLDELAGIPADGDVHELRVDGHGDYRLVAVESSAGGLVVTGLPTEDVDDAVAALVRWEVVFALLGTLVAGAVGVLLVRRELGPLTEVAATAHAVAALPLGSGTVRVEERVPGRLTDPRTETGRVGGALNTLLDHVETSLVARHRSEQQVRQFVADASHELRTPLATISGYTELARRQGDAETAELALTKVEEESARMSALVEDLLLLARLDAGRPLTVEPVDLSRLVVEVVSDARVLAPDHRWRVVQGEWPVEVRGDEHRLHQVLTNLLTNARKYTPAGSAVTVTVRADGFDVHDDGPGFPRDLVDSAFERFTRGDTSRQRAGGAGLGLALVRAIVDAHGGTVSLRSEPGDTCVSVRL